MNKVLELKDISLTYRAKKNPLLWHVSFSLHTWQVLSIIGKNGTGKSSLLKIIAGIETGYSGNLCLYTDKISYVPQKLSLEKSFPITVQEFFRIFNDVIDTKHLQKIVSLLKIKHLLSQNIHTLSGWEFQKVLITNALIWSPELLLLDEPTSGIDIVGEELFYEVIHEIQKIFPDLSIILVSHNIHLVYKHSTHVICLHENNFCCHGTPAEVSTHPEVTKIFWKHFQVYEHDPHTKHHHIH